MSQTKSAGNPLNTKIYNLLTQQYWTRLQHIQSNFSDLHILSSKMAVQPTETQRLETFSDITDELYELTQHMEDIYIYINTQFPEDPA